MVQPNSIVHNQAHLNHTLCYIQNTGPVLIETAAALTRKQAAMKSLQAIAHSQSTPNKSACFCHRQAQILILGV